MRMRRRGKADPALARSEAVGKLGGLLQTEATLEAMLDEAKQQARKIVDTAREEAAAQLRRFESHLENEHRQLRERIERERDETIASIRQQAELETRRLADLDDDRIHGLAHHVLDLLLKRLERGERP